MSGRPKVKRYQYDKKGNFLQEFESESAVRKQYYSTDKGKRPIFGNYPYQKEYVILPDGTYLTKERIGRVGIRDINKRINNEFLNISNDDKKVKATNLDNKVVATFANINLAAKMTNIPLGTIHNQVTRGINKFSHRGLIFTYE